MVDELGEEDPFGEDEMEHEPITEGMVRKATFLMHKYADLKGEEYKTVQKKCKNYFAYSNLAKMTITEGHAMITKLIQLTGGEEQAHVTPPTNTKSEEVKPSEEPKRGEKEDLVTSTMRKAIRAAVDITIKEVVDKDVPVQGLGGFVLEIGKVIFEAKMVEEVSV